MFQPQLLRTRLLSPLVRHEQVNVSSWKGLRLAHCRPRTQTIMTESWRPTAFILDFDGTITKKDTISTLFQFGIAHSGLNDAYEDIIARYKEDYSSHLSAYKPTATERKALALEIAYSRSLKAVEHNSFARVGSSGIFRGLHRRDWHENGGQAVEGKVVGIKPGFREFVTSARRRNAEVEVVSVNFSSDFIAGVLEKSAPNTSGPPCEVTANWLDERGIIFGPEGEEGEVMTTSGAKLHAMNGVLGKVGLEKRRVVYIGDSGTDIECLTREGVLGVVMVEKGESDLMETLKRVGIQVPHLFEYDGDSGDGLYWAQDFEEIMRGFRMSE